MRNVKLKKKDIITPYFVIEGNGIRRPIRSMPGIYRLSVDNLIKNIKNNPGVKAVLLFGIPERKDEKASASYDENGIIQKAVRGIKSRLKGIKVITDVCLCAYTSGGHCRIIKKVTRDKSQKISYKIDKSATLETLAKIALSHTESGADFVAPSAAMDGQVKTIRTVLDREGFKDTKILAYSAKYASNFYGPFREALDSAPRFGDRKNYQLDFGHPDEGLTKIDDDIRDGADAVMVKPALAYLDIIYRAKNRFKVPIAAYNVSGEYAMIKKLAEGDRVTEKRLVLEALTCIKRAGADMIITYWGKEVLKWLK